MQVKGKRTGTEALNLKTSQQKHDIVCQEIMQTRETIENTTKCSQDITGKITLKKKAESMHLKRKHNKSTHEKAQHRGVPRLEVNSKQPQVFLENAQKLHKKAKSCEKKYENMQKPSA